VLGVTIHKQSSLLFLLYWRLLKIFDMACKGADFCPLEVFLSLCRKRFQSTLLELIKVFPVLSITIQWSIAAV